LDASVVISAVVRGIHMADEMRESNPGGLIHLVGNVLDWLSGEYLLTHVRYPNGGTVVFLRALHVTVVIFLGALAVMNWLDPARGSEFSWTELGKQTLAHVTWVGAIFATVYALLYARFASQWTYLAGLYNQLKAAQARPDVDMNVITEWRAAFIEDCDELHLLRKPMFASIINELVNSKEDHATQVRTVFEAHSPGGKARLDKIGKEVAEVVAKVAARYGS
jgi:hypothetical protein